MKKLKKILLISVALLVALAIVAVIVVGFFLGDVVKVGMETVGPKVTQTSLTVSSVHVGILTGSASVNGLVLGNPDEYKTTATNAITVGKAAVSVAPFSVLSDKIVIKSVEVRSAEISFNGNPLGANNLKKIMANVNAFTGGTQAKPNTNAPAGTKPAKKLQVDDFLITGAKVHFNGATLPLPDIHFTDLGKGPEGITAGDLTKRVLGEITASTIMAIANSAGDLGKGAENLGKDAAKAAGDSVNKVTKGIGGLFSK
jgi:uncharacterized protein involved in outer membrane biogenesis